MREKYIWKSIVVFALFLTLRGVFVPLFAQNSGTQGCEVTLVMNSTYGYGWENAVLSIYQHGNLVTTATMNNGYSRAIPVALDADSVHLMWQSGWYDEICSFCFLKDNGDTLFASPDSGMNYTSGSCGSFLNVCPACSRPMNLRLVSRTTSQLVVGWDGEPGSTYRVEYAPYGTNSWTGSTTSNSTFTIGNLAPGQVETVRVRRICGIDTSGTREMNFITTCATVGCSYTVRLFDRSGMNYPYEGGYIVIMHKSGAVIDTVRMPLNTPTNPEMDGQFYDYTLQTCVDSIAFAYGTDSAFVTPWGRGLVVYDAEENEMLYMPVQEIEGNDGSNYVIPYYCPSCMAVRNLESHVLDSVRATISWRPNGGTQFLVEYGPSASPRSTYTTLVTTDTSILLTGLTISTEYQAFVRTLCGTGDTASERDVWFTSGPHRTDRIYVKADANGNNDGTSWANAYTYLSRATNDAYRQNEVYGNHPDVWVAAGTYYPEYTYGSVMSIYPGVKVYGGFAGTEGANFDITQRDAVANATILDGGSNNNTVINYSYGSTYDASLVDGFIAQNGYYGASVYSNTLFRNCIFRNNQIGLYLSGSEMLSSSVQNCRIVGNSSMGMYAQWATIDNTLVEGNGNQYQTSGGIYSYGNVRVRHCDIINNLSSSGYGFWANGFGDTIVNSIVWGNHNTNGEVAQQIGSQNSLTVHYTATSDTIPGTGNIPVSPENWGGTPGVNYVNFVNPQGGDYRLNAGSACINTATTIPTIATTDLAGNPRTYDNAPDMGCFENDGSFFCTPPTGLHATNVTDNSATIHWTSTVADSYTLEYAPLQSNDWTAVSNLSDRQCSLSDLMQYTDYKVRVTALCDNGASVEQSEVFRFRTHCLEPIAGMSLVPLDASYDRTYAVIPLYFSYRHSASYILIRSTELGSSPRLIDTIGFQFLGTPRSRDLRITISRLDHDYLYWSDTANLTDQQVVFRGTAQFTTSSDDEPWTYIPLDYGFQYNGTGAIVINIMDTSSTPSGGYATFRCFWPNTYSANTLYCYGDNYSYTSSINGRPYIYLSGGCDMNPCPDPRIAIDTVTPNNATLALLGNQSITDSWMAEYKLQGDSLFSPFSTFSTQTSAIVLNNLIPNTAYDFRLRRICTSGDTSAWVNLQLTTTPLQYSHVFVKADATGTNDGSSWLNAFTDLNRAVANAYASGQHYGTTPDVWVAAGVYYGDTSTQAQQAFTILQGVNVYGGFAGTESSLTQRQSPSLNPQLSTILDGQNTRRVLCKNDNNADSNTFWDGFTVRNASDGGVRLLAPFTLRNFVITACTSEGYYGTAAALYAVGTRIENLSIQNCNSSAYSSGSIAFTQNCHLSNFNFINNTGYEYLLYADADTILGATITGNSSEYELLRANNSLFLNTLFSHNTTNYSNFYFNNSTIAWCDFVSNKHTNYYSYTITGYSNHIYNSIIWGNGSNQLNGLDTLYYCAVEGGFNGPGNINLASDNIGDTPGLNYPGFVFPEEGNFHIASWSPCVNAATHDLEFNIPTHDIDGNARIFGSAPDMGCYEYSGETFCLRPTNVRVQKASSAALVSWLSPQGTPSTDIEYRPTSTSAWTLIPSITTNHYLIEGLTSGETYEVRLRSRCGNNNFSAYTEPLTFFTECTQYGVTRIGDSIINAQTNLPISLYSRHSYSQQIYLASELGFTDNIQEIQLQFNGPASTRHIKVYLGHTTDSVFSTQESAISGQNLTLVYDGPITFSNDSLWTPIHFTTPFSYNGTDNLLLAVIDYSNYGTAYYYFGVHRDYPNNRTLYTSGYNPYSVDSSYSMSLSDYRNNVRFITQCHENNCATPLMSVNNITDSSAQIICQTGIGQRVQLQYRRDDQYEFTTLASQQEQTLRGLRQNSTYTVRVRTICGLADTSHWNSYTFTTTSKNQHRFYVSASGTPLANGTSWQDATNDLEWALQSANRQASSSGQRSAVWIAQGTYTGDTSRSYAFSILPGVDVYGGFVGNETALSQRQLPTLNSQHQTILDGQNRQQLLYQPNDISSGDSAYWDGITLTRGHSPNYGGGAWLKEGSILANSIIKDCKADNYGGGVYVHYATLRNSTIIDDSAHYAGGVYCYMGIIEGCLIANNQAYIDGGIQLNYATMKNCNIVSNHTESSYSYNNYFHGSTIYNSVFWGNTAGTDKHFAPDEYGTFYNCAFEAEWPHYSTINNCILLDHNNSGNFNSPRFVQPAYSSGNSFADGCDWTLQEGSILIDHGDTSLYSPLSTDLAGNNRIQGNGIDIGCYESSLSNAPLPTYPQGRVYVVQGGAGLHDGSSWSNAVDNIANAITIAQINGNIDVWVAAGTYYGDSTSNNAFTMVEGVNLYGSFAGTETSLNQRQLPTQNTQYATILDGQNSRRVLNQKKSFDSLTVWDGFVIQNGYLADNNAAGANILGRSQLRNCIIQNNFIYTTSYHNYSGIGVKVTGNYDGADTSLWGCIVRGNYSQKVNNNSEVSGGGINATYTNIVNCQVYNNRCDVGAVRLDYGANMYNTIVANNQAKTAAGIYCTANGRNIYNCVIALNIASSTYGGIYSTYGSSSAISLYNSIVWGNKVNFTPNNLTSNNCNVYNSAVEGGFSDGTNVLNLAATNDGNSATANYPRFMDPEQNDFRLHPASHCLDMGDTSYPHLSYDLNGNSRIFGNTIDLGAYECESSSTCPSPLNMRCLAVTGESATFAWTPQGTETQWQVSLIGGTDALDTSFTVSDTVCTIGNLHLNHTYTCHVRANCGIEYSIHSPQVTFTTLCDSTNLAPLSAFSSFSPADSAIVLEQNTTFTWTDIPEATSYDFYIWKEDQPEPETPTVSGITTAGMSNYLIPNYTRGAYYNWKVVAWNQCISRASAVQTFLANPLPDLHVVDITHSQPVAGQPMTVTWTVRNDGQGATPQGATWYDRVWIVSDVEVRLYSSQDLQGAFDNTPNLQGLAPGETYTNSMTVTVPQNFFGNYYIFVFSDQTDAYDINFSETGGIAPDPYTPSVTGDPYHYLIGKVHYGGSVAEVVERDNFFYKRINILPPPTADLRVTHVSQPTQAFSNSDITVSWTVTNLGEAAAGGRINWFDEVYIQMGDEFDAGEAILLRQVKHWAGADTSYIVCNPCPSEGPCNPCHTERHPRGTALQPDSSYSVSTTVHIPIELAGDYSIFVLTDASGVVYESVYEGNNVTRSEQYLNVVMTPLSDLVVTSASMPTSVSPRELVTATWTVANEGAGATEQNSWYDAVYLSPTASFDSVTAIKITDFVHNGMVPIDGSYTDTLGFYIPKNISGTYYLVVRADSKNRLYEGLGEDNNIYVWPTPIQVQLPNLVVTRVTVPEIQALGDTVWVSATVKNVGPGTLYSQHPLSTQFTFDNETKVVRGAVTLAPGDSVLTGTYTIQRCPGNDSSRLTVETNVAASGLESHLEAGGVDGNMMTANYPVLIPDLAALWVEGPDSAWSGGRVSITYGVGNVGSSAFSSKVKYSIYISSNATSFTPLAAGRIYYDSVSTRILADSSRTFTVENVRLPNGIEGNYYLHLVIDESDTLCESDKGNNVAHAVTPMYVNLTPWPDLVVSSITIPDSLIVGLNVNVDIMIANNGIATATGGITTKVFISPVPTYNTGLMSEVASLQHTVDLGVGESMRLTLSGVVPTSIPAGYYYLYAVVDYDDNFYEHSGEENNYLRSDRCFVQFYPLDLVVDTIYGPDTLSWGETAKYYVRVRNNSNVVASTRMWQDRLYMNADGSVSGNVYYGCSHAGGLEAGASYVDSFLVTMPYGAVGSMILSGVCDYGRVNPDLNLLNNQGQRSVAVRSVPTPNLAVRDVEILDSVVSGQPFRIAYSVTNVSSTVIDSTTWNDRVTYSDVNGYTGWSLQLGLFPQNRYIDSGGVYLDTVEVTIPVPNQGDKFILVHANAQQSFYEADQANNMVAVPVNVTLPPPGDLTVTGITHPDTVTGRSQMSVSWTVTNIGNNAISGRSLTSLVYLSRDEEFSSDDRLLGTATTQLNAAINPGDSVTQQLSGRVNGMSEGNCHLIVKTDVRNAFYEEDENNNMMTSAAPLYVRLRQLPFDSTMVDTLWNGVANDYKLLIGDRVGETVRIHVESDDSLGGAVNNLFVSYNTVGDNQHYSMATVDQNSPNPELYIPSTRQGYYGVTLQGSLRGGTKQVVRVRADILPFELRSVNPGYGGNDGKVTVELNGSRFRPDMEVWLERDGDTLRPEALLFVNYYQAFARFDLRGADTGVYNMGILNYCEGEATMDSAFEVRPPLPDHLGYNIVFPHSPRPNRMISLMLEFGNIGNTDIQDAVLEVMSVGGCPIALTPEGLSENNYILRIPLGIEGDPQGLLRPGSYGTVTIYCYSSGSLVFSTREVE